MLEVVCIFETSATGFISTWQQLKNGIGVKHISVCSSDTVPRKWGTEWVWKSSLFFRDRKANSCKIQVHFDPLYKLQTVVLKLILVPAQIPLGGKPECCTPLSVAVSCFGNVFFVFFHSWRIPTDWTLFHKSFIFWKERWHIFTSWLCSLDGSKKVNLLDWGAHSDVHEAYYRLLACNIVQSCRFIACLQGSGNQQGVGSRLSELVLITCMAYSYILKMEVIHLSKTLVNLYVTTHPHIIEDSRLKR